MGNIEEINFSEGEFELSVRVEPQADTVWLNRQQMSQLFDRDIKTIGKHIHCHCVRSWMIQLSQNLRQLPAMEKHIRLNITIWT